MNLWLPEPLASLFRKAIDRMKGSTPDNKGKYWLEVFKTVWGYVGAIPAVVAGFDAWLQFLGISSAIKPDVYVLSFVGILFAAGIQVSCYYGIVVESPQFASMLGRARIHIIVAAISFAICYLLRSTAQSWMPENPWQRQLLLLFLMFLWAVTFASIAAAFTILGLRVFLVRRQEKKA
jgi:hypothetical protein